MVTITAFDFMSCRTPREQKGSALAGSATIVKDLSKDIANTNVKLISLARMRQRLYSE